MKSRLVDFTSWPVVEVRLTRHTDMKSRVHLGFPLAMIDAVSTIFIQNDLNAFYHDLPVEAPPCSFRDCVLEINANTEEYDRARDYWLDQIDSMPLGPELPLVADLGSLQGPGRVKHHLVSLSPERWSALQEKAARRNMTKSQVVVAAYVETLSLWSRNPAFSIVYVVSHRTPRTFRVVGAFNVNLILDYDRRPKSLGKRIQRFAKRYADAAANMSFSGVQLLRTMFRKRGVPMRAVFPVTAVSGLMNVKIPPAGPTSQNILDSQVNGWFGVPQVLIDHPFFESREGHLNLNFHTVDDAYPPGFLDDFSQAYLDTLERMSDSFANWLRPGGPPLPPAQSERRARANATEGPVPDGLLHEDILRQARTNPDAPAVISTSGTITFGELGGRAQALSDDLSERVEPNTLVAVVMDKGWEQVVAVTGILMSGAAYLPIDPGLPDERRRFLLKNAEVAVLVTQPALDARLDWPDGIHRIVIGDESDVGELREQTPLQRQEDLAYAIFTSGSTGTPKGVMIDHRGALNTCVDVNARFAVTPGDRVFASSALSFDLSVWDIFGVLAAGGALVMPEPERQKDPSHWSEMIRRHDVTIWNSTPTLMQLLVDHQEEAGTPLPDSLRLVMMSGDWIPVSLPDRIQRLGEDIEVYSLGGATEASIWSILFPIEKVEPHWRSVPYGKPMVNQSFHILNESLRPCPDWVPGELFIGGIGVAMGYWRDDEKTSASFLTLPQNGERVYRTGDLGRYRPDGNIEFLGREDNQVKVRGYRIELGEIEATLHRHPGVRETVVVICDRDEKGMQHRRRWNDPGLPDRVEATDKVIVGYYIPDGGELAAGDLRQFLSGKLPEYMVPAHLISIDRIPLTPNGKVDRRALPSPASHNRSPAAGGAAPRDELEVNLVAIWERVLGVSTVNLDENFFELGGDSALAIRVVAGIRKELGYDIAASAMFRGSTVRELAQLIRDRTEPVTCLVEITPMTARRPPFFCVHPVSGSVVCYADLAMALGREHPFVALQALGLVEHDKTHSSIIEMAAHYADLVRAQQPAGPYLLGGWSMGGVIALEMARQLTAAGQSVGRLAVIDASVGSATPSDHDTAYFMEWFLRDLTGMAGREWTGSPDEQQKIVRWQRGEDMLSLVGDWVPFTDEEELIRHFHVFESNARALDSYAWIPYDGEVALFAGEEGEVDGGREWNEVTGEVVRRTIPGNHFSLMRNPAAKVLANLLREYLWA